MKLVHLVGYIINKFVTMHGHTNVKKKVCRHLRQGVIFYVICDHGICDMYRKNVILCTELRSTHYMSSHQGLGEKRASGAAAPGSRAQGVEK